ncbi:MAG: DUF3179 domain-containing protein [Chloroflexi bacterium]|nr:DUF3179 domain-containing protein [Chloroflexota bacterium]
MQSAFKLVLGSSILLFFLAACSGSTQSSLEDASPASVDGIEEEDYEIVTLLPRDAIPAIDNPRFLSASEADEEYAPEELVMGVEFNGDARAYSVSFLSGHEIVNDTVGGRKISVTW